MRILLATVLVMSAACVPPQTPAPAAPTSDGGPSAVMPAPHADSVSVHALVTEPARYAGRTLYVRGRCLGWSGPALGSGPRTRSDWQLGRGGEAVWVNGPLPDGCSGPAGGVDVLYRGRVLVDTVTIRGTGQQRPRAFLVPAQG